MKENLAIIFCLAVLIFVFWITKDKDIEKIQYCNDIYAGRYELLEECLNAN